MSVAVALERVAERLAAAGLGEARREARLLLQEAMGVEAAVLVGHPERVLGEDERTRLERLVDLRAQRVPVAQVLGRKSFWKADYLVTADTLAPRPESETLIETALAARSDRLAPYQVLDLGTGTGCLLLALLGEWPHAWGVGVDRSGEALCVARSNAERLGLASRAAFVLSDWAEALDGRFDVILANPPYIPSGDIEALEPEVSCHEPRLALDGGADGLGAARRIVTDLARLLARDGLAFLEHGAGQSPAMAELARDSGLVPLAPRHDLAGHERCLPLQRAGGYGVKKPLGM